MQSQQIWHVEFRNGDSVWSQHVEGTWSEAWEYADSLCWEYGTRFSISPPSADERLALGRTEARDD